MQQLKQISDETHDAKRRTHFRALLLKKFIALQKEGKKNVMQDIELKSDSSVVKRKKKKTLIAICATTIANLMQQQHLLLLLPLPMLLSAIRLFAASNWRSKS